MHVGIRNAASTYERLPVLAHFHWVYSTCANISFPPRQCRRAGVCRTQQLDEAFFEIEVDHFAQFGLTAGEVLAHRRLPSAHHPFFFAACSDAARQEREGKVTAIERRLCDAQPLDATAERRHRHLGEQPSPVHNTDVIADAFLFVNQVARDKHCCAARRDVLE